MITDPPPTKSTILQNKIIIIIEQFSVHDLVCTRVCFLQETADFFLDENHLGGKKKLIPIFFMLDAISEFYFF